MKRLLRLYKPFTNAGIQEMVVYRVNFLFFLLGEIMKCFVMFFVWKAVFESSNGETLYGFTYPQMVVYLFISFLCGYLSYSDGSYAIGKEVLDGSIAMRMIKPVNFDMCFLFQELGSKIIQVTMIFLPITVGVELFRFFTSGEILAVHHLLLFIVSMILAYGINFYFNLSYGFLAFFLKNLWGTDIIKGVIIDFLSGATIPLAFMGGFGKILGFLPFASLSYTPVMIYMGMYDTKQILFYLGLQVIWLGVFILISKLVLKSAMKRLVVHGG
ncbi:MAG: ABC-2 family transporter protein [Eubacteriales bacterium]|nr:ABC-2 family transporter protein [Eubacteriales bacterium]